MCRKLGVQFRVHAVRKWIMLLRFLSCPGLVPEAHPSWGTDKECSHGYLQIRTHEAHLEHQLAMCQRCPIVLVGRLCPAASCWATRKPSCRAALALVASAQSHRHALAYPCLHHCPSSLWAPLRYPCFAFFKSVPLP